jgi:hypothetical protein
MAAQAPELRKGMPPVQARKAGKLISPGDELEQPRQK